MEMMSRGVMMNNRSAVVVMVNYRAADAAVMHVAEVHSKMIAAGKTNHHQQTH